MTETEIAEIVQGPVDRDEYERVLTDFVDLGIPVERAVELARAFAHKIEAQGLIVSIGER